MVYDYVLGIVMIMLGRYTMFEYLDLGGDVVSRIYIAWGAHLRRSQVDSGGWDCTASSIITLISTCADMCHDYFYL